MQKKKEDILFINLTSCAPRKIYLGNKINQFISLHPEKFNVTYIVFILNGVYFQSLFCFLCVWFCFVLVFGLFLFLFFGKMAMIGNTVTQKKSSEV